LGFPFLLLTFELEEKQLTLEDEPRAFLGALATTAFLPADDDPEEDEQSPLVLTILCYVCITKMLLKKRNQNKEI
jgi:hypothetical protein